MRKTWVLGSRGGAAVVVVLEVVARVVVVANVVVCREVLCTDQLDKESQFVFSYLGSRLPPCGDSGRQARGQPDMV